MGQVRLMQCEDIEKVSRMEYKYFSEPWSEKSFRDAVLSDTSLYLVMEREKEVVAYAGFFVSYESADLCNMLVDEPYRKKGLAGMMLCEAFHILKERGVEQVMLEVRASNVPAICLYETLGFEKIGIRKDYYHAPKEDAFLMRLHLLL